MSILCLRQPKLRACFLSVLWLILPAFAAEESARRIYNLPPGDAEKSLKLFSQQSGRGVLYSSDGLRNVRTNEVRGEFTARQAIDRLLAGTPLVAGVEESTGAFAIRREDAGPNEPRAARLRERPTGTDATSSHPPRTEERPSTMKRNRPLALLSAWLGLAAAPGDVVQAADPAIGTQRVGSVAGRVSNAATQVFLEGALVSVAGTRLTAITDREGYFELANVPAGSATLEIRYTGLTPQRVSVFVSTGEKATSEVRLGSDIYMMDQFKVAGIREGQAMAITQQRNAPNVKNVVSTDAFGNIADGNAAEALRLLPGVSAVNDGNESRYMMVRGIDANLSTLTIDGMKASTSGTDAIRQADMRQIPLGAVEIMEVTKSPTPDMDGDSLGGNINLRSASIFDRTNPRRVTFAASAAIRTFGESAPPTTYTTNRIRPTYAFGYSDVFGPNRNIGVSLNLSHTINWAPSAGLLLNTWEQTATSPAYLRVFTHYDYHSIERPLTGANLQVDYKVSPQSRLYLNSTYTTYRAKQMFKGGGASVTGLAQVATLDANGRPIPFQPQFPFGDPNYRAGGFNAAGARVQASILPGYTDEVTEMVNATYSFTAALDDARHRRYSFQPGGVHKFGRLEIDYSGLYNYSPAWRGGFEGQRNFIRGYTVQVANTAWRLDARRTGDLARREVIQTGGADVREPRNWTLTGLGSTRTDQYTEIYGGQLNVVRRFESPVRSYLKTGLKFMSESRDITNPVASYTYAGPQSLIGTLVDTTIETGVPLGLSHPFGAAPAYLSVHKINDLRVAHPEYFVENAATSLQNRLTNDKEAREEVFAGYLMGNVSLGRLSILGGVRVEKTTMSGESAVQDPRAGAGIVDPVARIQAIWGTRLAVKRDYQNVLPGLHFKYTLARDTLVRASYSSSFGRPSFGSVFPDTRINPDTERITQNNPGLLPQEADNFDLSIERYFEPVGVVSVGVFLKEIKNFLYSSVIRIPSGNDNGFNGDYAGWELATSLNGGYARVRGIELNYSQQLSFLPGAWGGLGVFANYTYLQTEGNYGRIGMPADSALVNFIPRVVSAGVSYSRSRYTARINANYTDSYLRAYNANPLLKSYRRDKTIVDVKLSYRYTRELSLFADAGNVFNAKDRWYSGPNNRFVSTVRNFGVKFQAGISGSF